MEKTAKHIKLVLEKNLSGNPMSGWIDEDGIFASTMADTVEEITTELKSQIADFLNSEDAKKNVSWNSVTIDDIDFDYTYNLLAFFEQHKELKITEIAKEAGINPNLIHQYAKGYKSASRAQVEKIQTAIHSIASKLQQLELC